jgi:hypothetical protein
VILSFEQPYFVRRLAEAVNFLIRMNHMPFIFMFNREDYAIRPVRNWKFMGLPGHGKAPAMRGFKDNLFKLMLNT